jgi:hypothetical protein
MADSELPNALGPREGDLEEAKRLRRLQIMMNMVASVIAQSEITIEEAAELVAGARRAALTLFPGKELAFDILYRPRLQRIIHERFGLQ